MDSVGLIPIATRNSQKMNKNTNIPPKIGTTVVTTKYPATKVNPIPTPADPAPTRGTIPEDSDSTVLVRTPSLGIFVDSESIGIQF
mgnify:FL=1